MPKRDSLIGASPQLRPETPDRVLCPRLRLGVAIPEGVGNTLLVTYKWAHEGRRNILSIGNC